MAKSRLLRNTILLLCLVFFLHFLANSLYLYWTLWWFDMAVHLLSGAIAGMAVVWARKYDSGLIRSNNKTVGVAVLSAVLIGIIWESYELHSGLTSLSDGMAYVTDTISDLSLDACGGFFGALHAHTVLRKGAL